MTTRRIPIDSTEAREQREAEQLDLEAADQERRRHDRDCRGGWLGEDDQGRPRPCLRCRPWLAVRACPTCSTTYAACVLQRDQRRGRCCPDCNHARPAQETTA